MKFVNYKYVFVLLNLGVFLLSLYLSKNHKNYNYIVRDYNYWSVLFKNFLLINALILLFFDYLKPFFIFSNNLFEIIIYCLIILLVYDSWLYWIHRSVLHRTAAVKQKIHLVHHTIKVIPADWINVHILEFGLQTFGLILPFLFFGKLNIYSFILACYLKQLFEVYIHSDSDISYFSNFLIDSKFHADHHKFSGGNYSQLFFFWDRIMGTVIN